MESQWGLGGSTDLARHRRIFSKPDHDAASKPEGRITSVEECWLAHDQLDEAGLRDRYRSPRPLGSLRHLHLLEKHE